MAPRPPTPTRTAAPSHAGWLLAGLVAIPFASVTSVALLADVASTTDPVAFVGIPALLAGVAAAYLAARAVRGVHRGAVLLRLALRSALATLESVADQALTSLRSPTAHRTDLVLVPLVVGRRGPPLLSL